MPKLEKALHILDTVEVNSSKGLWSFDPRAMMIVTLLYIAILISIPVGRIDITIWFALFPIISAPMSGLQYGSVFLNSLIILPLLLLIAIFNPIIDRQTAFTAGSFAISRGWLTFTGIILRGLFSMQALLILIRSMGFIGMVRSLERLGLPKFLTSQIMMVFRYMKVLIEEALNMKRAREARSYGHSALPLKMWGQLVGQLFIRSIERAERIHRTMSARGFDESLPAFTHNLPAWKAKDTCYVVVWCLIFLFLRIFNLSALFN